VPGTRPTTERTREALFSIWQARLPDAHFLELFCGSGAAGLEALSRGAASAVLIDGDRRAVAVAAANCHRLGASASRALKMTLPRGLRAGTLRGQSFDLVFADPPYDFTAWDALLEAIEPLLARGGEIAVEHAVGSGPAERVSSLARVDLRRYGGSALSFYRRAPRSPIAAGTTPPRGRSAGRRS
jgi:16S rRNA (guanine966-N2)-methyltransferase